MRQKRITSLLMSAVLVLASFAPMSVKGGIKIPKWVYSFKDLDKAKEVAMTEGKPLAFLYTDPAST